MLIQTLLLAAAVTAAPSIALRDAGLPPKGWTVVQQPKNEAEWICANYSQLEWAVSGDSTQRASISPYKYGSEIRLALSDGELIGTNHGEFGGRIEWAGRDAVPRVLVPDENPVALTRRGEDVFVATGLAHMSHSSGKIIRLRRNGRGSWQVSTVVDLGEAANAATRIDDVTWLVLTTTGLTRIDLSKLTKEQVYRNNNWRMLYANSIRPFGNSWLVGARRAVIRITPDKGRYTEEWLAPAGCRLLSGPNCECSP
ncbi:hypothetical protein [Agrilutibacter solisilvae]|uniref:Uncharacterized protein n=1 Tax=Agrilutibacter solisilvae TaxID=2763317 RepID=A0A974Y2I5_9GAMM|nr:hypothetical protein [Lysobacter solisilvae]QSX79383.1 hypothetical protein I8J32_005845 [Lysobacter solisilvae]